LIAHITTAARDLKPDHYSVADSQVGDCGSNLPNDSHGFVAQNVSDVHEGTEYLVEM
jgi:hypothetical protein